MVTMALTYPHVLIKLKEDGRQIRFGGIQGSEATGGGSAEEKHGSVTYTGQIDGNSIEIKVSATQTLLKDNYSAFRLEKIKNKFESLRLKTGDEVLFTYTVNEHNQLILTSIQKTKR